MDVSLVLVLIIEIKIRGKLSFLPRFIKVGLFCTFKNFLTQNIFDRSKINTIDIHIESLS